MKIAKINVYQKDLPYCGGGLAVGDLTESRTRRFDTFNTTVVVIETDAGIMGAGESCPWGANRSWHSARDADPGTGAAWQRPSRSKRN